jgi:hypothetical protein
MKTIALVLTGIALISSITVTAQAEWEIYYKSSRDDVNDIFIDSTITYLDKNTVRVWIKHENRIPKYMPKLGKLIKARSEYVEIDCILKRRRLLQMNAIDDDGRIVWSSHEPESWLYIAPDDWESVLVDNICKRDFWWRNQKKN